MINLNKIINTYLIHIITAFALAGLTWLVAYFCKKIMLKAVKHTKNKTVTKFLGNFIYTVVIMIGGVIVLSQLGIPTSTLVAIVGASSLAIGLSLRSFLSNLAAGMLIVFLRPFKINDFIQIGTEAGSVVEINLFITQLTTVNHEALFIPNNKVLNDFILNKTYYETKRLDLNIGISYDANIDKAKAVILQCLRENNDVHTEPEPTVGVGQLGDSAVNLTIRVWVDTDKAVKLKFELQQLVKNILDINNIAIPYPQLDVTVKNGVIIKHDITIPITDEILTPSK